MIILALDPGTSCGWAVGRDKDIVTSGTWWLAPARGESPGMRYIRLRGKLNEIQQAHCLDLVVFEMSHHRGGAATQIGLGLVAHIESWCAENRVEHVAVHSATLKKWATGTGKGKKEDMLKKGMTKFGIYLTLPRADDNEIDALWLLDYAMGQRWDVGRKVEAPLAAHEGSS